MDLHLSQGSIKTLGTGPLQWQEIQVQSPSADYP
jgi:hypothetical protein